MLLSLRNLTSIVSSKKSQPPAKSQPGKATNQLRVRTPDHEKVQLKDLLDSDPNYLGNISDFVNDCIRSYKFQRNRGEALRYPIEFVTKK